MAEQVFKLPDLGEGLTEAQLVRWRVSVGSSVEVNAPLCEVETAKALVVIPSPWSGTVRGLHGKPGETIAVGAALVTIDAEAASKPGPGVLVGYGTDSPPAARALRRRRLPASTPTEEHEVRAAPFVRQLAKEKGVEISQLSGSGPGGRVTREDVLSAAADGGGRTQVDATSASSARPADAPNESAADERISVVGVRKAIARQMVRSVSTIPQFTEFAIFDAARLLAARDSLRERGTPLTPLAFFIHSVSRAVRDYPLLNSSWDESRDEIVVRRSVNVGLAVNTEQGLLVPVLRQADRLELPEIATQAGRLVDGARAGTLTPAEMTGGTITITNVGASGPIETGTPIINPPECCVVGFGAIRPRPMVRDGAVVARECAWISISVDHRIVDGALATQFLSSLVERLERAYA